MAGETQLTQLILPLPSVALATLVLRYVPINSTSPATDAFGLEPCGGFGWSAAFLALLILLHHAPDQKMCVVTASVRSVEGFVIVEECANFDTAAALLDANTVATVSVSRVHFVEK